MGVTNAITDFNPLKRYEVGIPTYNFNPLFPYGKRPLTTASRPACTRTFQSTLPIREETYNTAPAFAFGGNFNPLFPYGKRLLPVLRAPMTNVFQSTLPIREETTEGR